MKGCPSAGQREDVVSRGELFRMRWSIRNQILVPIIAIQAVAVTAIAVATATLAASRSEREIIARLSGVIDTLGHARFPYTATVLAQMHGLSGAHFVAYSEDGRVAATSLATLKEQPPTLRTLPASARLDLLGESPTVRLDGVGYFAVPLRSTGGLRGSSLLVLYPQTSWWQARRDAATPPLLLGGGSLVLMVAVTSWIAHRISSRIRKVQQQVARIASGDFEGFEPDSRSDEVRDLAGSINRLCDHLKEMQRTIRQSERTRLLAQLAAGLAHQLRNSLTGARMSVQLHAKRFPPQEGDETLNVALRQLSMTEEQVRGLLSLGRVEQRAPEVCDLRAILAEVALLVDSSCQHAKVTLRSQGGDGAFPFVADPSGIRAAALNLALNAIEAAGPGGFVSLEALARGDEVAIEIADTGPGPPPELADALCEAFVTSKPEGVGLGLAVAQQVAVEHGGRLSWSREGGETRFRLVLPRTERRPRGAA
jgi:signal transduction histidine kinase